MSAKQPYVKKSSKAIGVEKNLLQQNTTKQMQQTDAQQKEHRKRCDLQQNCEDDIAILEDLLAVTIDEIGNQTGRAMSMVQSAQRYLTDIKLFFEYYECHSPAAFAARKPT